MFASLIAEAVERMGKVHVHMMMNGTAFGVGPLLVRSGRHRIHFMLEHRPQLSSEGSVAPPHMSVD
jgi:hypothetical protein